MDYAMPHAPGDRDSSWADHHGIDSRDNSTIAMVRSPIWGNGMSTARMDAGQLSPISTALDIAPIDVPSSSTIPTVNSATTSCASSWSTTYSEDAEGDDIDQDAHWEQGSSDDIMAVPKLEPSEDEDFLMDDVKEAPRTPVPERNEIPAEQMKVKRPRGRPRKHPLAQIPTSKVAKGRSKTGCITCRKRKKKCDEAKPRCMNCEKNAVVCEGYNEKTIWKSGRERAEEESQLKYGMPTITMQPIFRGVETPEDVIFLNHYVNNLSGVLTVEGQHKNAFKDMLFQMAVENHGLMHSILSLSSRHIDYETPYGAKLLSSSSKVTPASLLARSGYHYEAAVKNIYADIDREKNKSEAEDKVNLSVRYGQILCLVLQAVAEGDRSGEHRLHIKAYKDLIQHFPPEDSSFLTFISEFFQYRVYADEIIRFPDMHTPRLAVEDWEPWLPIQPARLIGVADGFFKYLTQITTIRNTIRANIAAEHDPVVDYTSLYRAAEIDAAIREWTPEWPVGDGRARVGLLYKQMMWIYLYRTIYPPSHPGVTSGSSSGLLAGGSPPLSPTSPEGFSSYTPPNAAGRQGDAVVVRAPSPPRSDSPPPIRYPPHHDNRITVAVDESLAVLETIKPSDPVQTLLLIPCVVVGCACFAPSQREKIRAAVRGVRGYTGLRNCDRVMELLEEVWRLMDRGDWLRVWDWQGVARSIGLDFSCA